MSQFPAFEELPDDLPGAALGAKTLHLVGTFPAVQSEPGDNDEEFDARHPLLRNLPPENRAFWRSLIRQRGSERRANASEKK